MRVAVFSDTHGNLTAFEAVLADIDSRSIDHIFHLGDVVGKGPRGSACCALARRYCDVVVRGNWDEYILQDPDQLATDALRLMQAELSDTDLNWLASLPYSFDLSMGGKNIRCYHASAQSVTYRVFPGVDDDAWDAFFHNTAATGAGPEPDIVVYGDIHVAYKETRGERTVINCGSVGNPFDEITACYLILDDEDDALRWRLMRVPYDIESELAFARASGLKDYVTWEFMLRTARVP